jgi:7,8-dihydroneopterin aldolase/epimerase/oxygenase
LLEIINLCRFEPLNFNGLKDFMNIIALEGIELLAPIGVYRHEKINGCKFFVDVYLTTNIDILHMGDDLSKTIDYEYVYKLIRKTMNHPYNLIESAIREIYMGLIQEYPTLLEVRIKIRKIHPLQGEKIESAFVEGVFKNK